MPEPTQVRVNGQKLLDALTSCTLFSVDTVPGTGDFLIIWSSGAAEQLEAIATACIEPVES